MLCWDLLGKKTESELFLITMKSEYRGNNRAKPDLKPSDVMAIFLLKLFTDIMTNGMG